MKPVLFSIQRVNRLRQAAEKAREISGIGFDGWFDDAREAIELVRVFDSLWLKDGFSIRAYVYTSGSNGNGVIWAVPSDTPFLTLADCPREENLWLKPPRPPEAIPLMQAIEGDGSPWSYLSASILARETAEFGAEWHGCVWSDQAVLSKPPLQDENKDSSYNSMEPYRDAPVGDWTWLEDAPQTWEPTFVDRGATREVVLHIHDPMGQERIYKSIDTYPADSYACQTETMDLCVSHNFCVY